VTRRRLDVELVRRGLAPSREVARETIRAGLVTVGGSPTTSVSALVAADQALTVAGTARRYVSRGGEKLRAALDRFELDPKGRDALDAGASTGGFTDCLLSAGAARVVAVDVGYGQLAWSLRTDQRVTVLERTNVRDLTQADLPFVPGLVVADLSFISLRVVMPVLAGLASPNAEFVLLVKPQFEAGRADVGRGGVVRDPAVWRRTILEVAEALRSAGIGPRGVMASPLRGPAGNREFLLYGRRGEAGTPIDVDVAIAQVEEGP
jgi:23S rRNA (cytidine1920-2'-O)/16S rRNA (cytidine1409-2'-O)-methyltransferase